MNQTGHSGHCRRCKERVGQMLVALYGECLINHSFVWSAKPEHYSDTSIGDALQRIRSALGDLRGHRDFIKSALLPPVDYYLTNRKLIVEFDESQHFTRARLISLSFYPDGLDYGYSTDRWKELCGQIDAKDDTPIDRDERRAWYDSLRDLIPVTHGFAPTARLYADDFAWCSLHCKSARHLEFFQRVLRHQA